MGENFQRLKSFPSNPTQSDISRAADALGALQKVEQALCEEETGLSKRIGLLYDKNNLLKPWAENESAFLKLNITNIKTILQ